MEAGTHNIFLQNWKETQYKLLIDLDNIGILWNKNY